MLSTTCFASGTPGHSWGVVATGRTSIAHKGMLHAAKIMALTAMDLYTDPEHLRKAPKSSRPPPAITRIRTRFRPTPTCRWSEGSQHQAKAGRGRSQIDPY